MNDKIEIEEEEGGNINYEKAKCIPLPTQQQFFSVEYPGYVKNIDRVLKTLGGQKGLKKAINEDMMELWFRPDDPFSHPINGNVIPTSNLLLKVTRRKRRYVKCEVIGIISKTCRFRNYQYIPNPNDSIPKYRKALENLDAKAIMNFQSVINNKQEEDNLPPPIFSPSKVLVQDSSDQESECSEE
ncbi:3668_t:CDS:2 [Entrophospora sp. SA101]|nr:3659_t:CDS:2 [Entrophospora sp. SA101]CAJ0640046.1 3668_t:CDS:2 [Entrophospora sp. SA101]CAJ0839898.1 12507_t:CDS:2 [Entrophospora sp. SA101]CAJ0842703.1 654_t:CDS:2 [Entrophospora sp. SA101]